MAVKKSTPGRKFLLRTFGRLFDPETIPVLQKLNLLHLDSIAEIADNVTLLKLKEGVALPTLKQGMFILLQGNLKVKTHWKAQNGMEPVQTLYSDYICSQQGHLASEYLRKGDLADKSAAEEK